MEEEVHKSTDDARAGSTPHIVRYVLTVSLTLALLAMIVQHLDQDHRPFVRDLRDQIMDQRLDARIDLAIGFGALLLVGHFTLSFG